MVLSGVKDITAYREGREEIKSLQSYHEDIKASSCLGSFGEGIHPEGLGGEVQMMKRTIQNTLKYPVQ